MWACLHAQVWLQGCAYLQNYSLVVEICIVVNLDMKIFFNQLGSFCTMYLKMHVKKGCIHYSLFMDYFLASVVSAIGEPTTTPQQEQRRVEGLP